MAPESSTVRESSSDIADVCCATDALSCASLFSISSESITFARWFSSSVVMLSISSTDSTQVSSSWCSVTKIFCVSVSVLTCSSKESLISRIPSTERVAFTCSSPTIWFIFSTDSADWLASFAISSATTAKPRPASPARAASMLAFRARRLV